MVAAVALAAMTGACATTAGRGDRGVDVTRFHLNQQIAPGTFTIEPLATNATISPEYRTYADSVSRELTRLNFRQAEGGATQYVVGVGFMRGSRGFVERRPPVSIGLGAGGANFGRRSGVGLGGGVGFGVGGGQREVIGAELGVQIRRRSDGTTIWEGRAVTEAIERTDEAQPVAQAGRLANAMFRNFPGESGITTRVR